MAGFILVAFTGALALLGVWLLWSADPDTDDWCDCGQPLWYHADFFLRPDRRIMTVALFALSMVAALTTGVVWGVRNAKAHRNIR